MRTPPLAGRSVSLRRWTPLDDPFVARLSQQAFAEYTGQSARYVLRATHRANTRTWIALEGGVPVGMIVLERQTDTWSVLAIAVEAAARARGIGGRLMAMAETYAGARGARRLSLQTADANLAALDLFLRRGFRIVRRIRGFYARGQDACLLAKDLSP